MINKQLLMQQIAQIFVNNAGNRLTLELSNGILQEIVKLIPEPQENVDNPTTDTSTKE